MKKHQGIWLPDHEQHLVDWMTRAGEIVDGRGTYQIKKLRKALEFVKNWRTAIDVGAHVGFWSMHIAPRFQTLRAFEPIAEHRECWLANMAIGVDAVEGILYPGALGNEAKTVNLSIPQGSSGGTHVELFDAAQKSPISAPMWRLDDFQFQDVDFIKIDCEGYELAVLEGAVETLKRWHPCVIVEQKQHIMAANFGVKGTPAVDFLVALGAGRKADISGDYILAWD